MTHDLVFPSVEGMPGANVFVSAHLRDGKQVRVNAPGFTRQDDANPMFGGMPLGAVAAMAQAEDGGDMPKIAIPEGTREVVAPLVEQHLAPHAALFADDFIEVPRLIVSDMDSTMIGQECLDELADFAREIGPGSCYDALASVLPACILERGEDVKPSPSWETLYGDTIAKPEHSGSDRIGKFLPCPNRKECGAGEKCPGIAVGWTSERVDTVEEQGVAP